jgi:hypothetical protein
MKLPKLTILIINGSPGLEFKSQAAVILLERNPLKPARLIVSH